MSRTYSEKLARLKARRDPDGIEARKGFVSPTGATSGLASYQIDGVRPGARLKPRREKSQ